MMKSGVRTGLSLVLIVAALTAGSAQGGDERSRATYRGANPQAELSVSALTGLRDDGFAVPSAKPSPITTGDVTKATHIFAIGCSLPTHAVSSGKAESWDDVPDDQGYAAQRDAIKKHVERLLDQLEKR